MNQHIPGSGQVKAHVQRGAMLAPANSPLAYRVITPRNSMRELSALETAMQGLGLDARHPLALELAGGADERTFIMRATTPEALEHAVAQIRARYPQADFVPLTPEDDPFHCAANERVSAIELTPGAAAYLPLRTWDERALEKEGADPLLGLLATIEHLPAGLRAIAQVALVPASPSWSVTSQRKAVEHPLEKERMQDRTQMSESRSGGSFSTTTLVGLFLLLILVLLWNHLRLLVPPWVLQAIRSILHGQLPTLSDQHRLQFYGAAAAVLAGAFLLYVLFDQVRKRLAKTPIYDQRLVSQRTTRMAYRVRLRLYTIGPGPRVRLLRQLVNQSTSLLHAFGKACTCPLQVVFQRVRHQCPRTWSELGSLAQRVWNDACKTPWSEVGSQARTAWEAVWSEITWRRKQARHRRRVLTGMVAAYRQFHLASGNYFVPHRLSAWSAHRLVSQKRGLRYCWHGWHRGLRGSRHYVSVDNLAALWHLPQAHDLAHLALVAQRPARTLLISPDVAAAATGERRIGVSAHAGHRIPFCLTEQWLRLHALILGKSGEGKSTLLEHIAYEAMQKGGCIAIDPHGDLTLRILRLVPSHRRDDVVLIDLADSLYPVGINPLDITLGRGRDKAIADLLETLSHIWMHSWGSRMENAFEVALRTAWEANKYLVGEDGQLGPSRQFTLLDILPLYTSESFCHSLLQFVSDPYIHRWWREYYEPLPLYMKRDIINPVATKVAKFESEIARRIVGQGCSTINLTQIIQERKILLIRLAKGTVGADAAPLLGATLLGLIQVCLEEQGAREEQQREQFPILIDEFQVLEGVDWSMLAQLRKYGATFFLATQSLGYLQELDRLLLPTVLANVRQLYCFNLSAQDAWTIHREFGVEADDIINLDSHMCYVRLKLGVRRQPTFSLQFDLPPPGDSEQAEAIRFHCRDHYAHPAHEVDEWLRQGVARQRMTLLAGRQKVEAVEADPKPPSLQQPASLPTSSASQGTYEHAPRRRGQRGKGKTSGQGETGTQQGRPSGRTDQKPQVATTPDGEALSTPLLFTSWGAGEKGGEDGHGN